MTDASIFVDSGHTTRIPATVANHDTGVPINISSAEIIVRLVKDAVTVNLTEGAGVTVTNAAAGQWAYDVTLGNLATLGNPDTFDTFVSIFNADNTVLLKISYAVNVSD